MLPKIKTRAQPYLSPCPTPFSLLWPRPLEGSVFILLLLLDASASSGRLCFFSRRLVHPSLSEPFKGKLPGFAFIMVFIDIMPLLPRMVIAARQVFEDEAPHEVSAFKYYFILIGVAVVMVAFLLWHLHRRTRHRREFCGRESEQLPARDLQTGSQPRRFMYGIYEASNSFLSRQSEGLDQNGSAPPPYQPKSRAPTIDVEIPLPTLSRSLSQRSQHSRLSQYPSSTEGATSTTERQEFVYS